jgi:2-polyprenyl-6-methoxyphenol hydroxylase-like FAD-dependent oxidoreductase
MAPIIAIVGGGPCGLTLARLLECKGIDYVVFERDEFTQVSERAGGSLDIHQETGQRALREAGLFDEFSKQARNEDQVFTIYDKHGKRWAQHGDGSDAGRPEIDRLQLRQILLNSIPKEKIRWGASLKTVASGKNGAPVLTFTDGSTASGFDLVVGADGAWSKVRPAVSPEPR